MNHQDAAEKAWWKDVPEGKVIPLAFLKVDRVGSTLDWSELPDEAVLRLRARYTGAVAEVARSMDAVLPLSWQGDGTMLFLTDGRDGKEPAPIRAFEAARLLWERMRVDLRVDVRIGVNAGNVKWNPDTGKIAGLSIDLCGHLEHVAPDNAVVVSEDVYLALPEKMQTSLRRLGITCKDRLPAYVFPAGAAERKKQEFFIESDEQALWDAFRRYTHSPEIGMLRYVGLQLSKKKPPCLRVEDVFVQPEVRIEHGRRRRLDPLPEKSKQAKKENLPFEWMEETGGTSAPVLLKNALLDNRSLVLLGDPGSGKTTCMRWLAATAACGRWTMSAETGIAERLFPLPVSVGKLAEVRRDHDGEVSVPDALARYFYNRNVGDEAELRKFLVERLEAGECLVLLDGLDEAKEGEREDMRAWLETFAHRYNKNRFIATSRRVGYTSFSLPDSKEAILDPFSDEQVERYVRGFTRAYRNWETGVDDKEAAEKAAAELIQAISEAPRLKLLSRNPFLLSAMALIHRAEGRLPRHRILVYDVFCRALCETWAWARRLVSTELKPDISYEEEAIPLLGELALRMHEAYPTGIAPKDFVTDTLAKALNEKHGVDHDQAEKAAHEFLKKAGQDVQILLERGIGEWGFMHLTFQEFFVAAGLHASENFEKEAFEHLFDPRWEEIIRLGVGYMAIIQRRQKRTQDFIEKVLKFDHKKSPWITRDLKKQVALAALLVGEADNMLSQEFQKEIAQSFASWVLDMPDTATARALAETALTDFGNVVAQLLLDALKDKEESVRLAAARALGEIKAEAAIQPLIEALKDKRDIVRRDATLALGEIRAKEAVKPLLAFLEAHPEQRKDALAALWEISEAI